ncbi:MAG: hypothetical protein KJO75_23925, partial [Dactylosporangium sp.]|nr:hypothetical protein [Dactylosporangium sp.]
PANRLGVQILGWGGLVGHGAALFSSPPWEGIPWSASCLTSLCKGGVAAPYPGLILALFAAALAVLVAATFMALEASSGVPGDECLLNAEDLQAWTERETLAVYRRITSARWLTITGICAIALGCGTAWLAPSKPPDAPLVRVDSPAGPICGRMTQVGGGVLRIETTGHGVTTYHIAPLNAMIQVNVVTKC